MIKINGTEIPYYPNNYDPSPIHIKTDTSAIDGTPSRMQGDDKQNAILTYEMARPACYQYWKALYDAAASVTFYDDDNNTGGIIEFTGILTTNSDAFIRGGSMNVPLVITISEGVNAGGF